MKVSAIDVVPYVLPLLAARPLSNGCKSNARFRRGWLVRMATSCGREGFGDAAAWPGFSNGSLLDDEAEASHSWAPPLAAWVDARLGNWVQTRGERPLAAVAHDWLGGLEDHLTAPELHHAVETAALDLLGQLLKVPIAYLLHGKERCVTPVSSHVLTPFAARSGIGALKVKVAHRPIGDDCAELAAIEARFEQLGLPTPPIRLDAGGRLSATTAASFVKAVATYNPVWIEQPFPARGVKVSAADINTLRDFSALLHEHGIRLALDESVIDPHERSTLIASGAADVLVIKPMFVGGLTAARDIVNQATAKGIDAIVTHALETTIGRAATFHLASGLVGSHGLGPSLARDVVEGDYALDLDRPGLGVSPGAAFRHVAGLSGAVAAAVTIRHPLFYAARDRPDGVALIRVDEQQAPTTFSELAEIVSRVAAVLTERGVRAGDRVGLQLDPKPGLADLVTIFAAGWLGATAVLRRPYRLPTQATINFDSADFVVIPSEVYGSAATSTRTVAAAPLSLDYPLFELMSSGTTGVPKPTSLTVEQLVFSAFGAAIRLGHEPRDRWLCCLPLYHVGGLSVLLRCLWYQTTAVFWRKFDPENATAVMQNHEVTQVSLVPAMLSKWLVHLTPSGPKVAAKLRLILLGGARASAQLLERCRELGLPIALTWGMTEAASQVCTGEIGRLERAMPPLPFAEVAGPSRACGALSVSGPTVGGTHLTTDAGCVDSRGWVEVVGRLDHAITSGGVTFLPESVETVLVTHPAVVEAAVYGCDDATWGQRPVALLVAADDVKLPDRSAFKTWCRTQLSPPQVPDRISWVERLPRNELGKLKRAALYAKAPHPSPQIPHPSPQIPPAKRRQPTPLNGKS